MNINARLAMNDRDIRINLFLGLANWFIFLDHIPNNVVNWLTVRNFGFSGAADLFVFVSGFAAATAYAKIMLERGFIVGATRIFRRAWQLYAAYIVLFVIYIVSIAYVAARYMAPDIIGEYYVATLIDHPLWTLTHGVELQSKALNLDVLQLYTILMALFAPVLWMLLRWPGLTIAGSLALYFAARWFDWNLSSFPDGNWYFNPFCWQLLFVFGAWVALDKAKQLRPIFRSPAVLYLGIVYLVFALVMTLAGRFPTLAAMFPGWLFDAFNPNDRTNLAPYRVLHFFVVALVVTRFVSKDWRGLKWPVFQPLVKCGEQSVSVFCVGVFLSFISHFMLTISSGSVPTQIFVSGAGLATLTLLAYYMSWSQQQDAWKERALLSEIKTSSPHLAPELDVQDPPAAKKNPPSRTRRWAAAASGSAHR
jgi:hypothetical protein